MDNGKENFVRARVYFRDITLKGEKYYCLKDGVHISCELLDRILNNLDFEFYGTMVVRGVELIGFASIEKVDAESPVFAKGILPGVEGSIWSCAEMAILEYL